MSLTNSPSYTPYGAYELKATYQRNLTFGTFIVTTSVLLLVAGGWLFASAPSTHGIIDDDSRKQDTILIVIDLPNPISLERPPVPPVRGGQPPAEATDVATGFVPTADELVEVETVMPTREEIGEMIDGQGGGLIDPEGEGVPGGFDINGGVDHIVYPESETYVAVDQQPEMVYYQEPEYPRLARDMGIEGKVWVTALIDIDGSVREAKVLKSSGSERLDDSAVQAAYDYKYKPAIKDGEALPVWVSYQVVFELD